MATVLAHLFLHRVMSDTLSTECTCTLVLGVRNLWFLIASSFRTNQLGYWLLWSELVLIWVISGLFVAYLKSKCFRRPLQLLWRVETFQHYSFLWGSFGFVGVILKTNRYLSGLVFLSRRLSVASAFWLVQFSIKIRTKFLPVKILKIFLYALT